MPEITTALSPHDELTWDRDHTAQLVKIAGQTLTIDMAQAETVEFNTAYDVHYVGVTEAGAVMRELGDMVTVTLTVRAKAAGVTWVDADPVVGQDEEG